MDARIGPDFGTGVPVVDGGVILQARIGRGPGGVADLLPQIARLQGLRDLAVEAAGEIPLAVVLDRLKEGVGQAHRIVRVLARDGEIGLRFPVGVVGVEFERRIALAGELDDALDDAVRNFVPARGLDLALERRVLVDIEAVVARALAIDAGAEDRLQMPLDDLGAGGERGDFLLLVDLPVDEGLDVGVIDVDHDHFGRAARRAARLDRARRAVADLQERHEPRRAPAAGELLVLAAQGGEIGAGAGAVFEQARLAHPQVHDPAFVDEIVGDRLDEAGVRLGMLVGRLRLDELSGLEVDVIMALARPIDAIGPMEPGVEPLRRIGRGHLARQHEPHLVVIGARVVLGVEEAGFPAPIGPGAGEAVEHLLGRDLGAEALALGERAHRRLVGNRAPQEGGNALLLDPLHARGDAGFTKIFLRQHVGRDLAPGGRNLDAFKREHDRAVGIADLALRGRKRDEVVRADARLREVPFDAHRLPPRSCGRHGRLPAAALDPHAEHGDAPMRRQRASRRWPGPHPAPKRAANFTDQPQFARFVRAS